MSRIPESLVFERDLVRFGAARVASSLRPGAGGAVGPLRHRLDPDELELPGPDWVQLAPRLSGICASDLAAVDGRSSRWFEPIVSMPFVPGHEVVADVLDGDAGSPDASALDASALDASAPDASARRVVVEPVLGCVARGISPVCAPCSEGRLGNCGNLAHGCLEPGLQTGFCESTGGGWSTTMLAHPSQLHDVPADMSDEAAVMVEPSACALHGALAARVQPDELAAVIGAGTMGLGVVAALARWSAPASLLVAAKHDHQRQWARDLGEGIDLVCVDPAESVRAARRMSGCLLVGDGDTSRLTEGLDVTIDCVGSAESLATALAITRPGGRVVMVGMPGVTTLDLTPLWHREISVQGAYTYGTETIDGAPVRTFELAMELVLATGLDRLVTATYPLDRSTDAIAHAAAAGRRGAVKIAFAPRSTQ